MPTFEHLEQTGLHRLHSGMSLQNINWRGLCIVAISVNMYWVYTIDSGITLSLLHIHGHYFWNQPLLFSDI